MRMFPIGTTYVLQKSICRKQHVLQYAATELALVESYLTSFRLLNDCKIIRFTTSNIYHVYTYDESRNSSKLASLDMISLQFTFITQSSIWRLGDFEFTYNCFWFFVRLTSFNSSTTKNLIHVKLTYLNISLISVRVKNRCRILRFDFRLYDISCRRLRYVLARYYGSDGRNFCTNGSATRRYL